MAAAWCGGVLGIRNCGHQSGARHRRAESKVCSSCTGRAEGGLFGCTEPGAGSDVSGITATAVKDGDQYVLNGGKTFITAGTRADFVTLLAGPTTTPRWPHFFVVERGRRVFSRKESQEDGLVGFGYGRAV